MNKKSKGYIFIAITTLGVVGMSLIAFILKNNARKVKKKEPWYVLKYLKVFMPKGNLLDAGIAEVYASVLAMIFGTFVSHSIKTVIPPDNTIPLWSDGFGVLIGCLITLFIMTRT